MSLSASRNDEMCRPLMTIPGVGPVVSLAFTSTIDIPQQFKNSKAVGSIFGLTPKLNESEEGKRVGCISLSGDTMMRTLPYEAAQALMTNVRNGLG